MKILIVDDEPLARERLQRLVLRLRPMYECQQAESGQTALDMLAHFDAQLVLLDVQMPGMDGMAVAARLAEMPEPPAVIFCTAYDHYALDALRHHAAGYLLKPIREGDLAQTLVRAGRINRVQVASLKNENEEQPGRRQIASQGHRGLEVIDVSSVRCFIADQKYVTAIAPGRELLLPDSLRELEQEFSHHFLRVHRNALVAPAHVLRLARSGDGSWCVELDEIDQRPVVSRRHLAGVKERLLSR
ncbi:MAG: LytR/AlgR family response regulator transcription factor [Parahaliea sp.]